MEKISYSIEAIEYIAKIADGGMRDAITLLDKCLAYSDDLTLSNVVQALGAVDYNTMFEMTTAFCTDSKEAELRILKLLDSFYSSGKDLLQFIRNYEKFLLDILKYSIGADWRYLQLPKLDEYVKLLKEYADLQLFDYCYTLLDVVVKLENKLRYSSMPKTELETALLIEHRRMFL